MKAIVFDQFGEPGDVLRVVEVPTPEPGHGQVRVKMIASPINPSDLLVVRGRYGVLPTLPATPGFEGVGIVDKVGGGLVGRFVAGKRVAVINHAGGNWAEYAVIPALQARPVPDELPDDQVASFFVNPMSVLALVRHVLAVPRGAWLLQSAAGSSLGKMIIRLCREDGIRTINVVRRAEAVAELKELGGDVVLSTSDGPLAEQVRQATGGAVVRHALDPVGGDTGTQVFDTLADDGRMVVYGTLTGEPIRIDSRRLIAGKRVLEGVWLGLWMRQQSKLQLFFRFKEVGRLIGRGVLSTEVAGGYAMGSVLEAVRAAEAMGKPGKVLLRIGQQ